MTACSVCKSTLHVRRFAITITVDGEPLRLQPDLCQDHGDRFLLLVGKAMGEVLKNDPPAPEDR